MKKINKRSSEIYKKIELQNPSPFLFFFNFDDFQIIGSSPEILVLLDQKIRNKANSGNQKRGKDKNEDNKLAKDLLSDPKEISEHLMLLDLGRNDVGRVSEDNTVKGLVSLK